jgi:hypothetical protein
MEILNKPILKGIFKKKSGSHYKRYDVISGRKMFCNKAL